MASKLSNIKFIVFILLTFICSSSSGATKTIISEGSAVITAGLKIEEYRQRAIEDALQNMSQSKEQALTSFTIVENGVMLVDQIQSISKTGVVSYKLLKEHKKNNIFHVTIEAILKDSPTQSGTETQPQVCRKTLIRNVDFQINLRIDPQQFPAWMMLDTDWIKSSIENINFQPNLVFLTENLKVSYLDPYKLPSNEDKEFGSDNIYKLELDLNFTRISDEKFFVKETKLGLQVKTQISRKSRIISNSNYLAEFTIARKFGIDAPIQNNKKVWGKEKERLKNLLSDIINEQLDQLRCVYINATLEEKDNSYLIAYGALDGITKDDIFVLNSTETEKFYFNVTKLKNYETHLNLISQVTNLKLKDMSTVRIVEGL